MARVMIWGGSGRSGQAMACTARAHGHEVLVPTHAECDLLQPDAAAHAVLAARADVVINCAAISGLEACADDALAAHLVNAASPAAMALACRHTGGKFIHLSTDYVLDGRKAGLKDEGAHCKPICVYAESKREGELEIAEANAESLILRVSWLCGNPARPGFPESMARKALTGQPLAAIDDKVSLPTDVYELAHAALQLAQQGQSGIWHVCSGGEPMSWWQSARIALETLVEAGALPQLPPLTPQKLEEVSFFREARPRHTAMSNARLLAQGICMSRAENSIRQAVLRWLGGWKGNMDDALE